MANLDNDVGTALAEEMSPEEIIDIKQEIHERFPNTPWPDLTQEHLYIAGYDFAVPGIVGNAVNVTIDKEHELWEYAIDGKIPNIVRVCSEQYNFVPYEVATKVFVDFIESYDAWGKPTYSFQIIDGGSKMKAEAHFNEHKDEMKSKATKVGDVISPLGGFYHSIDLSWMFRVFAGATRLVCLNGMVGHGLNLELGKKHKSTLNINDMVSALEPTFEKYGEQLEVWNTWGDTLIKPTAVDTLITGSGFGTKHQEAILALPEKSTGETVQDWIDQNKGVNVMNLYNVLTQFTTHELESELVKVKRGEQIASTFETFDFRKAA
jgi:hypothetical protein